MKSSNQSSRSHFSHVWRLDLQINYLLLHCSHKRQPVAVWKVKVVVEELQLVSF